MSGLRVNTSRPAAGPQASRDEARPLADAVLAYAQLRPTHAHSFLACARLPASAHTAGRARPPLKAAGFTEKSPGYFAHPDGSWVAYPKQGGAYRGLGKERFNANVYDVGAVAKSKPTVQHLTLAIADPALAQLTPGPAMDRLLRAKGFKKEHAGFFLHPDTSFVAIRRDKVLFGAGYAVFAEQPSPAALPTAKPSAAQVLAAAPLWELPGEAKAFERELLARGFTLAGARYYTQGNLFAGVTEGQPYVGASGHRYATTPDPRTFKQVDAEQRHRWFAVSKTQDLTARSPNLAGELAVLGFTAVGKRVFTHPDSSWVAVIEGELLRGAGTERLGKLLPPAAPGEVQIYDTLPSRSWAWFAANTALGRTPRLTAAGAAGTLASLGYLPPAEGTRRWNHPDGSWFEVDRGLVRPGFQKWPLGQLPFNNRMSR